MVNTTPEFDALQAIVEQVEKEWDLPGWTCTWEHPGFFDVNQGGTDFDAGICNSHEKLISVDLRQDWNVITSWAIPYKGKLTAQKMIKAIKACITIYETEEI